MQEFVPQIYQAGVAEGAHHHGLQVTKTRYLNYLVPVKVPHGLIPASHSSLLSVRRSELAGLRYAGSLNGWR